MPLHTGSCICLNIKQSIALTKTELKPISCCLGYSAAILHEVWQNIICKGKFSVHLLLYYTLLGSFFPISIVKNQAMDFSYFFHYVWKLLLNTTLVIQLFTKKIIGNMSLRYLWVCEMRLLIPHALIPQTSPWLQNKCKNSCASVEYKELLPYDWLSNTATIFK